MPAPKRPELYEQLYFDIAEALKSSQKELRLPFDTKKEAEQVRIKFYRFRGALERSSRKHEDKLEREEYKELYKGIEYTRVFLEKTDEEYIISFRHSRMNVSPGLEKAHSVLQQELMKRKSENLGMKGVSFEESGEDGMKGVPYVEDSHADSGLRPSSEDGGASIMEMFSDDEGKDGQH